MLSDAVQELLEEAAVALFATSLDAERMAGMAKRREARNIVLLSNASRDLPCRRFTHRRDSQAAA